jgi:UDP-N-acetylmuramate dehydrogenase
MKIQENISLQPYNTFGIDKKARFFVIVSSILDLKEALAYAKRNELKTIFLGGGSNILLTEDLNALIIKIEIKGIELLKETEDHVLVEVGAGENWHEWVLYTIQNDWAGIENLSLIPGTVGASPMQNIGAYGVELKDVFHSLRALNRSTGEVETFDAEQCEFGYRESVFKHKLKDVYVICYVTFQLSKKPVFHTEYGIIRDVLAEKGVRDLSIKAISDAVIAIRQSKLPDPKKIGNAGSFFKNPTIDLEFFEKLKSEFPEIPAYPVPEGMKLAAGWLIEKAGWKGKRVGNIGVHDKQALVLVNHGNGDGKAIAELSKEIRDSVREKFGVELHPEVNFL